MAVSAGHEINIPDLEVNLQQLIIRHEFVHHEIRTLRQKRRREQIHETRMERTDVVLQGAVAVYCLSNYNIQLGLLYLKVFGEYPTDSRIFHGGSSFGFFFGNVSRRSFPSSAPDLSIRRASS